MQQANSVLALAGLAVVCEDYAQSTHQEAVEGHLSHARWLRLVAETLLSVLDIQYTVSGRTLAFCQQVGVQPVTNYIELISAAPWSGVRRRFSVGPPPQSPRVT